MSGAMRLCTSTAGSILRASHDCAPFSSTAIRLVSARLMVTTEACCMLIFMAFLMLGGAPLCATSFVPRETAHRDDREDRAAREHRRHRHRDRRKAEATPSDRFQAVD